MQALNANAETVQYTEAILMCATLLFLSGISAPDILPENGEYSWETSDGASHLVRFNTTGDQNYSLEKSTVEHDGTTSITKVASSNSGIRTANSIQSRRQSITVRTNYSIPFLTVDGKNIISIQDPSITNIASSESISYAGNMITHSNGMKVGSARTLYYYDGLRFYQFNGSKINPLAGSGKLYINNNSALYSINAGFNSQLHSFIATAPPKPEEPFPESTIPNTETPFIIVPAPTTPSMPSPSPTVDPNDAKPEPEHSVAILIIRESPTPSKTSPLPSISPQLPTITTTLCEQGRGKGPKKASQSSQCNGKPSSGHGHHHHGHGHHHHGQHGNQPHHHRNTTDDTERLALEVTAHGTHRPSPAKKSRGGAAHNSNRPNASVEHQHLSGNDRQDIEARRRGGERGDSSGHQHSPGNDRQDVEANRRGRERGDSGGHHHSSENDRQDVEASRRGGERGDASGHQMSGHSKHSRSTSETFIVPKPSTNVEEVRFAVMFKTLPSGEKVLVLQINREEVVVLSGSQIRDVADTEIVHYVNNRLVIRNMAGGSENEEEESFGEIDRLIVLDTVKEGIVRHSGSSNVIAGGGRLYANTPNAFYSRNRDINTVIAAQLVVPTTPRPGFQSTTFSFSIEMVEGMIVSNLLANGNQILTLSEPQRISTHSGQVIMYQDSSITITNGNGAVQTIESVQHLITFDGQTLNQYSEGDSSGEGIRLVGGEGQLYVSGNSVFYSTDSSLNDRIGAVLVSMTTPTPEMMPASTSPSSSPLSTNEPSQSPVLAVSMGTELPSLQPTTPSGPGLNKNIPGIMEASNSRQAPSRPSKPASSRHQKKNSRKHPSPSQGVNMRRKPMKNGGRDVDSPFPKHSRRMKHKSAMSRKSPSVTSVRTTNMPEESANEVSSTHQQH